MFLCAILLPMLIHGQSDTLWLVNGQLLTGDYRYGGDLKSVSLPTGGSISADQLLKVSIDRRTYYPVTVKSKIAEDTYLAERITTGWWELLGIKLLELDVYNRSSYQSYYYLHRDEQTILINRTNPRDFLAVVLNDCFTKDNLPAVTYRQDDLIRVMEAYHKCKHGGEFTASRERYSLNRLQATTHYGVGWVKHLPQSPNLGVLNPADQPTFIGIAFQALPSRGVGFSLGATLGRFHLESDFDYYFDKTSKYYGVLDSRPGLLNYEFNSFSIEPGFVWVLPMKHVNIMPIITGKLGGVNQKTNINKLLPIDVEIPYWAVMHLPEESFEFVELKTLYGAEAGIQMQFEVFKFLNLIVYPFWYHIIYKNSVINVHEAYRVSGYGINAGIAVPIKQFH